MATRKRVPNSTAEILRNAREQTMLMSMPKEFHDVLAECAAGRRPKDLVYEDRKLATTRRHQFYRIRPLLILQLVPGALASTAFVMRVEEDHQGRGWLRFVGLPDPDINKLVELQRQTKDQMDKSSLADERLLSTFIDPPDKVREKLAKEEHMSPEESARLAANAEEAKQRQRDFLLEVAGAKPKAKPPAKDNVLDFFDSLKEPAKVKPLEDYTAPDEQAISEQLKKMIDQPDSPPCPPGQCEPDLYGVRCVKCNQPIPGK